MSPVTSPGGVRATTVLLDIEGTVGSKSFLTQVLYPYAQQRLRGHVAQHRHDPVVAQALADTTALSGDTAQDPVDTLLAWIAQDRKAPPLKKLQGLIWQHGFEAGEFQGHLFADVAPTLQRWRAAGIALALYSSGSVQAQQLYFGHSVAGDLRPWLSAYFDTDVGPKVHADSYTRIAHQLQQDPALILFLSDSAAELQAAREAGLQVLHVVREDTVADPRFAPVHDFNNIRLDLPP